MASDTITIEVDAQTAAFLRDASRRASANGETLGDYLSHISHAEQTDRPTSEDQLRAWKDFVRGMSALVEAKNLPAGYQADDSRDSIYDD